MLMDPYGLISKHDNIRMQEVYRWNVITKMAVQMMEDVLKAGDDLLLKMRVVLMNVECKSWIYYTV